MTGSILLFAQDGGFKVQLRDNQTGEATWLFLDAVGPNFFKACNEYLEDPETLWQPLGSSQGGRRKRGAK